MPSYLSSDITSKAQIQANHAGPNVRRVSHTFSGTLTAATDVAMMRMPTGGKVMDGFVLMGQAAEMGTMVVSVTDNLGNTYLSSAAPAARIDLNQIPGTRLTSSAHLNVVLTNVADTGTSALQVTLVANYLAEDRGD